MIELHGLAEQLKNARSDLSEEQADNVLESVMKDHSSDYGVSEDTLFFWAERMYPRKDTNIDILEIPEILQADISCLNCGFVFKLASVSKDELGWHTSCTQCQGSFDVDLPNGEGGAHG